MSKASAKTSGKSTSDLDLALQSINKKFGEGALMKLGDATKMNVSVISSGSLAIDLALGVGGLPRGRIVEIYGPESSGKTTFCLSVIAEAQRNGGNAVFVDVEHALDPRLSLCVTRGWHGLERPLIRLLNSTKLGVAHHDPGQGAKVPGLDAQYSQAQSNRLFEIAVEVAKGREAVDRLSPAWILIHES